MLVQCPRCGKSVVVKGLGRKPLNIDVKNILDALRSCHSVTLAVRRLGCSRGYIYQELKKHDTTPSEFISRCCMQENCRPRAARRSK